VQKESWQFDTPVLFLIFNRPDLTRQVFGQIRKVKPRQLFVAADGPRVSHPDDVKKCDEARKVVMDMIDWECEVQTLFREQNLGCGLAVSGAITWFFEHVEMGIILEDDCYPDLSFFRFCAELLEYYKDDERVMHISGSNFQFGKKRGSSSYYISKYPNVWGWATWKRSWKHYEHTITNQKKHQPRKIFNKKELEYWDQILKSVMERSSDSWDYRWNYSIFRNNGNVIVANKNLILNLGYGENSTHTKHKGDKFKRMRLESMDFPLIYAASLSQNESADKKTFTIMTKSTTKIQNRVRNILYAIVPDNIYKNIKARFYNLVNSH